MVADNYRKKHIPMEYLNLPPLGFTHLLEVELVETDFDKIILRKPDGNKLPSRQLRTSPNPIIPIRARKSVFVGR